MAAAPSSNYSTENVERIPRPSLRRYSGAHVGFLLVAARIGAMSLLTAADSLTREADLLLEEVTR